MPRTRLPGEVSARLRGSASGFGAPARRAMFLRRFVDQRAPRGEVVVHSARMVASARLRQRELYEPETLRARPADVGSGCCLLHPVRAFPAARAGDDVRASGGRRCCAALVRQRASPSRRSSGGSARVLGPPRLVDPAPQPHHRRRSLARRARDPAGHAVGADVRGHARAGRRISSGRSAASRSSPPTSPRPAIRSADVRACSRAARPSSSSRPNRPRHRSAQIDQSINSVRTSMEELSANAEETSTSILEMSASIEEVSRIADTLAEFVEQTSSAYRGDDRVDQSRWRRTRRASRRSPRRPPARWWR